MFRLVSFVAAALLLASPAYAQERTADVDKIFSFATPETPGCAVGVSRQGKVIVNRAYGLADVESKTPLTESSLFDIGSAQKQFTAAAVLLLVEKGRLSLSDDIRKHLPELPDYGHKVTVDHLLTHTGGVRDWTGLLPLAPESTEALPLILRQRGLNFAPGEEWSYSNSGYVLLKEIVARASGMTFADFARARLFAPLGMKSTAYVPDILQAGENAALGYQKEGDGWKKFMRLGNNRGGGAIVSTIGDLLLWNDALASGRLGKFVTEKLHEPAKLRNGRKLQYARGLRVEDTPGGRVVSHSGGAAGFSTWLGRVPEHGLSVVVTCNFDPVSATALGGRVADLYLPPVEAEAEGGGKAAAPAVDLTGRAGLYFDQRTGEPLRLNVTNGALAILNGPRLVPLSADRFRPERPSMFFRSADEFELTFRSKEELEIESMEGETTRYRRAEPWTPSAADVQAIDGRYRSEELGAVFEIVPRKDALVMRAEDSPEKAVELEPVARDTWMRSMMIVRVRRDGNGKVVGLDYGNPVVRNIRFTRLGERAVDAAAATHPTGAGAPVAETPATPAPAAAPAPERLTGEYELAPGRLLVITLEDGRLYGQPAGSEKRSLTHVSDSTFSVEGSPMTLTFTLDTDGRATAVVMRQNGRERALSKVR